VTSPPVTPTAQSFDDPEGRWTALAVLATACFLGMSTWFSASAVLGQLRQEWSLDGNTASFLTISVQLGFVFGAVLSAVFNLADVVSPRRLMLWGALGAASVNGGLVLCDGPALALPLRFATGAALALVYPPGLKAIATWFRRGRGTALGVMVGALTLGSALPHLLRGLGGLDWRPVILGTSLLTLVGGLIAEFAAKDGPFPFPIAVFDPRQTANVFRNQGVRLAGMGYFGHMWELYAMWSWFAVFFADVLTRHGSTQATREAAYATFAVIGAGALGCAVAGRMGDHWGRTRTTALSMVLSGGCALLIGWPALSPLAVLALGLVWGFWVVADSAQFSTIVTEVADQSYVGTAVTLQLAVGFTLTVATIWLVPVARDAYGWHAALGMLALGPLLGVPAMLKLRKSEFAARISSGRG
jgi:MFS family permease